MATRRNTLFATIIGAAAVAVAGRSFRRLTIAEHSMEPSLSSGDYVLARRTRRPSRGDIVTFRNPLRHDMLLVKRIVGLPGERVTIQNGQVHVDAAVLAEPWADGPTRPDADWHLDMDHVVVLSDNRAATLADSRILGPISVDDLEHRVLYRYWPAGSVGKIT
jgi:signal peptidase I